MEEENVEEHCADEGEVLVHSEERSIDVVVAGGLMGAEEKAVQQPGGLGMFFCH